MKILNWFKLLVVVGLFGWMLSVLILPSQAGEAPKVYPGPYVTYVTEAGVYDGDTINVEIHTAPGQILMTSLRVAGVDTPEIKRSGCKSKKMKAYELQLGDKAKDFVAERYPVGSKFRVRDLRYDKWGGRHVALVERKTITGWVQLDDELLRKRPRIADPYGYRKPGPKDERLKKIKSWCEGQ